MKGGEPPHTFPQLDLGALFLFISMATLTAPKRADSCNFSFAPVDRRYSAVARWSRSVTRAAGVRSYVCTRVYRLPRTSANAKPFSDLSWLMAVWPRARVGVGCGVVPQIER